MRALHLCFLLCLFLVASRVCSGKSVEVVGSGECTDCTQPSTNTVSGLLVSIDCKDGSGDAKTRSEGKLDEQGKFTVSLTEELVEDGELKEECYARLHSTSGTTLCPVANLEASKIVLKSSTKDTHKFETKGKLKFSQAACTASHQSLFHEPDYYLKHHPIFKKKHLPHIPIYKKPIPPIPVYKKPLPPPIPVHKKPLLPPIPVHKKPFPPIPVYKKPLPPPIPVYKKPLLPPIPVHKKPFYKPIYKKPYPFPHPPPISIPIYKKPCPPLPHLKKPLVPIYKKPLPSFPFPPKPFP